MNISKKDWGTIWKLFFGIVIGAFLVITTNFLIKISSTDAWLNFFGALVGAVLSAVVSFIVARMQIKASNQQTRKQQLQIIKSAIVRFKEEEENISAILTVKEPSGKLAIENYNQYKKRRSDLIEQWMIHDSFLTKEQNDLFENIFKNSNLQANNYLMAHFSEDKTKEVAGNNIGKGKWKEDIEKGCEQLLKSLDEENKNN